MIANGLLAIRLAWAVGPGDCSGMLDSALEAALGSSTRDGEARDEASLPQGVAALFDGLRSAREATSLREFGEASDEYDLASEAFLRGRDKGCRRGDKRRFIERTDQLMYEYELGVIWRVLDGLLAKARGAERFLVRTELEGLPMFVGSAWEYEISEVLALVSSLGSTSQVSVGEEVRRRVEALATLRACIRRELSSKSTRDVALEECGAELPVQADFPMELEVLAQGFEAFLRTVEQVVRTEILLRALDAAKVGEATDVEWAEPIYNELLSCLARLSEDQGSEESLEAIRRRLYVSRSTLQSAEIYREPVRELEVYVTRVERGQKRAQQEREARQQERRSRGRRRLLLGSLGSAVLVAGGVTGVAVTSNRQTNRWTNAMERDEQLELSRWGPGVMGGSIAALAVGVAAAVGMAIGDCTWSNLVCGRGRQGDQGRATAGLAVEYAGGLRVRF